MNVVLLSVTVILWLPPSPERIKELVKQLEVPTRHFLDKEMGPPVGDPPKFDYGFHWPVIAELKRGKEAAVPPLLALLEDKSKPGQARAQAAAVLIEQLVGTKSKPDPKIIAAINAALKDQDAALRWGVLCELPERGLATNRAFWEQVKKNAEREKETNKLTNSPPVNWGAIDYLRRMPPPEERSFTPEVMEQLLPEIIARLADDHARLIDQAARTISSFGLVKRGVPELIAALKRKEPDVRQAVVWALSVVGQGDPTVLEALLEQFRMKESTEHPQLRNSLIAALGGFGPEAKVIVPQLIEAVKDNRLEDHLPRCYLHDAAVHALGNIGPDAKAAIPTLMECLDKKYYPGDSKPEGYYQGNREEVVLALERIDAEVGKKARAEEKRKHEEYLRWYQELSRPAPAIPNLPLPKP
jgi:HEAT repeat protein